MTPRLTTLDADGWELDDAEELNKQHPATFQIPSLSERSGLGPGRRAKLVFLFLNAEDGKPIVDGERMWERVDRECSPGYIGVLASAPATSSKLSLGDAIYFEPRHVATALIPRTDPRHPEYDPNAT